jgi:hypothetical protein
MAENTEDKNFLEQLRELAEKDDIIPLKDILEVYIPIIPSSSVNILAIQKRKKQIAIDIDGVIIEDTGRWDDYSNRKFISGAIEKIKQLSEVYDIVFYTSRKTEEAFWPTIEMFYNAGLDEVSLGIYFDKPICDFYIDDKAIAQNLDHFLWTPKVNKGKI